MMQLIKREEIVTALSLLYKERTMLLNKGKEMLPSSRIPKIAMVNRKIKIYQGLLNQC